MMRRKLVLVAFAACAATSAPVAAGTERPLRRTAVRVDPERDLAPDAVASHHISKIIFVNRCEGGCTVNPGVNDSRHNTSSIPSQTSYLTEFEHGEEIFENVIECVEDVYSPYNVWIVTEDPGADVFHHEAILAGHPGELGLASDVGGIAPTSCEPLNNIMSFSFANAISSDVEELCWTVAQESAHAFGLPDHVYECLDPMTYLEGCGRKYFRNLDMPCGEGAEDQPPCRCGRSVQNSHRALRATFGDGTPPPPPRVEILAPADGATVQDNFTVSIDARDPRLVDHLELYVNGWKQDEVPGHHYELRSEPYELVVPDLPDGYLDVEIRAYNDLGSEGVTTRRYLKGAPCTSADACLDHQQCVEGACRYPSPEGDLGDRCEYDEYCATALCAEVEGERRCSASCIPGVDNACPPGFACTGKWGSAVCWPERSAKGSCAVAGDGRGHALALGLAMLLAAVVLRTGRQSSRH